MCWQTDNTIIERSAICGKFRFIGSPDATRSYRLTRQITPYLVNFGSHGEVQEITWSQYQVQSRKTKEIMIKAMERLALELNWKNTSRYLNCRIISYNFGKNPGDALTWHSDTYEGCEAKYTFNVLLNNPDDPNGGGWTGGDFLYSLQLGKFDMKTPEGPVWRIAYTLNDAILFGNQGMMHQISLMHSKNLSACRNILSISDYGNKEDFESTLANKFNSEIFIGLPQKIKNRDEESAKEKQTFAKSPKLLTNIINCLCPFWIRFKPN